ncbi:hypothetical protein, partial [uncultured Senegalimassilia sp.]|uniref:hypothetical protein n=1 Tax=uncultured Senegalimassilia sp. TaxID=1714350 RepID=UPI0026047A5D
AIRNPQSAIRNPQSAITTMVPNSHYVRCKSSLVMAFQQAQIGKMALRSTTHPVIIGPSTSHIHARY